MIFIGTASSIRQGVLNGDDFAGKELQGNNISRKTCVKDMTKKEIKRLHRELKTYRREGIPLLLNGRQTTAKRIEEAARSLRQEDTCGIISRMTRESFGDCPSIL